MSLGRMPGRLQIPDTLRRSSATSAAASAPSRWPRRPSRRLLPSRSPSSRCMPSTGRSTRPPGLGSRSSPPRWRGCAALPVALYRWVWGSRQLEQLARLLAIAQPRVGDHLLGVLELAHSDSEQARSLRLCEAAIEQVAEDARHRDFRAAVPNPRHRTWAAVAAVPLAIAAGLFAIAPAAALNALSRLVNPWSPVPRYTFAAAPPAAPEPGRRTRRAVHHHRPTRRGDGRSPREGHRPARWPAARPRDPPRRPLRVRPAPADQLRQPRPPRRRRPPPHPHRADLAARVDRRRRRRDPAEIPRPLQGPREGRARRVRRAGQGQQGDRRRHRQPRPRLRQGRWPGSHPQGRDRHRPRRADRWLAHDGVHLARHPRPRGQVAVRPGDHRARRRGALALLRGPAPPEGRARLRTAQLQGQGPRRLRRQGRRVRVEGRRRPEHQDPRQGREGPVGGRA